MTIAVDHLDGLNPVVEIAAYRIVTEALTNVSRHAGARAARLTMRRGPGRLTVILRDDGVGLPEQIRTGTGLRSMRERTEELGGTFEAHRLPGGGTQVTAVLPWTDTQRPTRDGDVR